MQRHTPVSDPVRRGAPRLTAVLVAAVGLAVCAPVAVTAAAVIEFAAQARKVTGR